MRSFLLERYHLLIRCNATSDLLRPTLKCTHLHTQLPPLAWLLLLPIPMAPKSTLPFRYIVQRPSLSARPSIARYRCLHVTSVEPKATLQTAVTQDHAELKRYYDQYKAATAEEGKIKWGNAFIWEMTRHALGEELVVYPGETTLKVIEHQWRYIIIYAQDSDAYAEHKQPWTSISGKKDSTGPPKIAKTLSTSKNLYTALTT